MFDRTKFDKTRFDRSSSSGQFLEPHFTGSGAINSGVIFQIPLPTATIDGRGDIAASTTTLRIIQGSVSGEGDLKASLSMRLPIEAKIQSNGDVSASLAMQEKITIDFQGSGTAAISTLDTPVIIPVNIGGSGSVTVDMSRIYMTISLSGAGDLLTSNQVRMQLLLGTPDKPLTLSGAGDVIARRLGDLGTEFFSLEGIDLQPGSELIIDTDELDVYIDDILNVVGVTTDSVFIQLLPGKNDLVFETNDPTPNLDVNVVWQNRWL